MADLYDWESRYGVTTRTGNGQFDQVLGLSQGIINENFVKLYDMYDELKKYYFSEAGIGKIDAELDAPKLLIPSGKLATNYTNVLFQVRFKSGSLTNNTDRLVIPDLKGWSIAVAVEVVGEDLSTDKITDPNVIASRIAKKEWLAENFEVPNDYSIERLYAKLSSAKWQSFDKNNSYAGVDEHGNPVTLESWSLKEENQSAGRLLTFMLGEWAAKQDKLGKNAVGLSFKLPKATTGEATFEPTAMMHQVYPYKSSKQGAPDGSTGYDGAANSNCLLYCEMVNNHPMPDDLRVVWSGNYATQFLSDEHKAIKGSFVMNRAVFLEKYLLTEFRALNQASDIVHSAPRFEIDQKDQKSACFTPYGVGYDSAHPTDNGGAYNFTTEYDPQDPRLPVRCVWTKKNPPSGDYAVGPVKQESSEENCSGKAWTRDEMRTEVNWKAGSNEIVISGKATAFENGQWTRFRSDDFNDPWAYFYDQYEANWKVSIFIEPVEDVPKPGAAPVSKLSVRHTFDAKDVSVKFTPNQKNIKVTGRDEEMRRFIEERLKEKIPRIMENIRRKFEGAGRFVYPGNGRLIFTNPVINKWGDLLAEVNYRKLEKSEWIVVPTLKDSIPAPRVEPSKTGQGVISRIAGKFWLTWTVGPSPIANDPDAKVSLRATNSNPDAVYLNALSFGFKSGGRGGALFAAETFVRLEKGAQPATAGKAGDASDTKSSTSASTAGTTVTPKPASTTAPLTPTVSGNTSATPSGAGAETHLGLGEKATTGGSDTGAETPATPKRSSKVNEVELLQSSGPPARRLECNMVEAGKGFNKWVVKIVPGTEKVIKMEPGAWVEIVFNGRVNGASAYEIDVDEDWKDDKGESQGHFGKPIGIVVKS
ncbi:uncharacterized protein K460DRAFT_419358 [Cucurbitaria berberidis CBS 394.84]|uniref:Uncharacterized protein n=1 Tax=Cucurbitaria berberidis CBS 394.84 TaxID=1168544 RepID=A0A9P4GED3_9PLEO|nr:uncharacterized protein K460DRAFT_419358 [Cucurbitaria berberidis CBS 394.84]KAF1844453.1 hypothetical protein K460DRAFT_419358 [Cucurbitaria berberidis CBS 394.84]